MLDALAAPPVRRRNLPHGPCTCGRWRARRCPPRRGHDALVHEHRADRLVTGAQPLGDRDEVGADAFLLEREERPRAAHAAHDLVGDEQHVVAVADLADAAEVARRRGDAAGGGAHHRLRDEGRDTARSRRDDRGLECVRGPHAVGFERLVRTTVPVRVDRPVWPTVADRDGAEGLARPEVPPIANAAERLPGVAPLPRDDDLALRLSALEPVLPCQLERRLDGHRALAHEKGAGDPRGCAGDQVGGERLHRRVGEERRMHGRQRAQLGGDRVDHARVVVAQARHGGAAGGVEIAPTLVVEQVAALAAHGRRQRDVEPPMEHGRSAGIAGERAHRRATTRRGRRPRIRRPAAARRTATGAARRRTRPTRRRR